jgi:exonuclease III
MKLGTLNLNGIIEVKKQVNLSNYIKKNKLDIVCFQETHLNTKEEPDKCFKQLGGQIFYSNCQEGRKRGVCTWFSPKLEIDFIEHKADNKGRIISVKFRIHDYVINLINIYAPNIKADRVRFLATLNQFVIPEDTETPECEYIFAGDWNCIEDYTLDKLSGSTCKDSLTGRLQISDLKSQFDLVDIFREFNPLLKKFTFYCDRFNAKTRIDRIYVSPVFKALIEKADISPCTHSDHDLAYCNFHLDAAPRGPGTWKLNNSFLQDKLFRVNISKLWQEWQTHRDEFADPLFWWDLGKVHIKSHCQYYGKVKKALQSMVLNSQQREYDLLLESTNNQVKVPTETAIRLDALKQSINKLESVKSQGFMIRSKVQYREEGERCTNFCVQLEK